MAWNKSLFMRILLASFIFCALLFNAAAQTSETNMEANPEATSQNRIVRGEDGSLAINQIIYFPEVENVFRYEVEIESADIETSETIPVLTLETRENFFEVSLGAGNYRYRITAYNRMNLIEGRSEWQDFQIIGTTVPVIENYKPFYGLFYEMSESDMSLTVYGEGFFNGTEFALTKIKKNFDWTDVSVQDRSDVIIPTAVTINENEALLTFLRGSLKKGNYEIFARNPGGLWASFGHVRVGYQNRNEFIFEYGWAPTFDHNGSLWDNQYVRLGWFPLKFDFGYFGIGTQFFRVQEIGESENAFLGSFSILYQYRINERMQHNARFDISPFNYESYKVEGPSGEYTADDSVWYFGLGYSFQYFIWKNLYAQAGIDLLYGVNFGDSGNTYYKIAPSIGIGFQIGRWGEQAQVIEGARRERDYSVAVEKMPRAEHILSVGWAPVVPLAGIDVYATRKIWDYTGSPPPPPPPDYAQGNRYLSVFNPGGFSIRYAYMPHIWDNNKFGYETELTILGHENYNLLDPFDILNSFLAGIRYQRVLNDDWYLNARIAIGFGNAYKYNEDQYITAELNETYYSWEFGFAFNAGVSVQYFFWNNIFAQASLDITTVHMNGASVLFRPGISVGWQFRRGSETGLRPEGTGLPFME